MTTGIYSGISAADLGHEPDAPVATCPKCDGAVMRRNNPPRGLVCISCGMVYGGMADIDEATLYYESLMWEAGRTAHCKHTLARAIAERAGLIKDDPHQ